MRTMLFRNRDTMYCYAVGDGSKCCGGAHAIDMVNPKNPTDASYSGNDGYSHGKKYSDNFYMNVISYVTPKRSIFLIESLFFFYFNFTSDILPKNQMSNVSGTRALMINTKIEKCALL